MFGLRLHRPHNSPQEAGRIPSVTTRRRFLHTAPTAMAAAPSQAQTANRDRLLAIPPSGRLRVVLDTDTYNEIDDQYAVAYSILSPERMQVDAIYAAPYLNTRSTSPADGMEKSYEEILRLSDFLGYKTEGRVFKGSEKFFARKNTPVESPAATDLIDKAMAAGNEPLYVLTIGCPVNVSSAILMEPKIKEKIVVVWLGGTTHYWPAAYEFNLKQDGMASQVLFDSGVALVQVPTKNVSEHLRTTIPELAEHLRGHSRIGDYLYGQFLEYYAVRTRGKAPNHPWSKVIWDFSVIGWLNNPDWVPSELVSSPVLTDDMEWETGSERHDIRVATNVNRDEIFADLFRRLSRVKG